MENENAQPNLTLEPSGGKLIKKGTQLLERYSSPLECSMKRNIPRKVLLLAAKENPPGIKSNGSIFWEIFQPWLADNYNRLFEIAKEKYEETSSTLLQEEKLKQEIIKLKNYNRSRSPAYIQRKLVFDTINRIKTKWTDLLRQKLENEFPARCNGMNPQELKEVGKNLCDELLRQFATPISQWANAPDIPEEDEEELD